MGDTHWVYVFAHKSESGLIGPVKVGISKDVNLRLSTIQTSCPYPIDLAYVFECPARDIARAIERSFHDVQHDKRSHGEWFNLEPVAAIHLLCLAFRAALSHNIDDPVVVDAALDCCGVYWAEKRFNLAVPLGARLQ
jgi:hypothetical protein